MQQWEGGFGGLRLLLVGVEHQVAVGVVTPNNAIKKCGKDLLKSDNNGLKNFQSRHFSLPSLVPQYNVIEESGKQSAVPWFSRERNVQFACIFKFKID